MNRIALLVLMLAGTVVDAETIGGFTLKTDGMWWRSGQAFRRSVQVRNGCRTNVFSRVQVQKSVVQQIPSGAVQQSVVVQQAPAAPLYTKEWKTEMLRYLDLKDDRQAYLQALGASGIGGQYRGYAGQSSYYGAGGNTVYGANGYGVSHDVSLDGLYQSLERTTQSGIELGRLAHAGHVAAVMPFAKVAVIRALAQGASTVTATAEGQQSVSFATQVAPVQNPPPIQAQPSLPGVPLEVQAPDPSAAANRVRRGLVLSLSCARCHNPAKREGGLDLSSYESMSEDVKLRVWKRLTHDDASQLMPRDATGKGHRLPDEHVAPFRVR